MKRLGWVLASMAVLPLLVLATRKKKQPEIQCIKAPCGSEGNDDGKA